MRASTMARLRGDIAAVLWPLLPPILFMLMLPAPAAAECVDQGLAGAAGTLAAAAAWGDDAPNDAAPEAEAETVDEADAARLPRTAGVPGRLAAAAAAGAAASGAVVHWEDTADEGRRQAAAACWQPRALHALALEEEGLRTAVLPAAGPLALQAPWSDGRPSPGLDSGLGRNEVAARPSMFEGEEQ